MNREIDEIEEFFRSQMYNVASMFDLNDEVDADGEDQGHLEQGFGVMPLNAGAGPGGSHYGPDDDHSAGQLIEIPGFSGATDAPYDASRVAMEAVSPRDVLSGRVIFDGDTRYEESNSESTQSSVKKLPVSSTYHRPSKESDEASTPPMMLKTVVQQGDEDEEEGASMDSEQVREVQGASDYRRDDFSLLRVVPRRVSNPSKSYFTCNIFDLAGCPRFLNPSLSTPAFCAEDGRYFAVGTEDQAEGNRLNNFLILGKLNDNLNGIEIDPTQAGDGGDAGDRHGDGLQLMKFPLTEHVRDTHWINERTALLAVSEKLCIIKPNLTTLGVDEVVYFPAFHTDSIRQCSPSPINRNIVLSGGFDGNVFVTDIERLDTDISRNRITSENSKFRVNDVVSSVAWKPSEPGVASATTDVGVLHMFDTREQRRSTSIIHDTQKAELYTHAFRGPCQVMLGYGDGSMQVFDLRNTKEVLVFQDPYLGQIGDIRFDADSRRLAFFGAPSVTVWENSITALTLMHLYDFSDVGNVEHVNRNRKYQKTNGNFIADHPFCAATDAFGNFSIIHVPVTGMAM